AEVEPDEMAHVPVPRGARCGAHVLTGVVRRRTYVVEDRDRDLVRELGPGGEVAVERRDPHARGVGDGLERDVATVQGEQVARRADELGATTRGIRSHGSSGL